MFNKIKDYIAIIATISTILFAYLTYQQKQETNRATDNLYKKEVQWTDEKGRLVTEVTELRFTTTELKKMRGADTTKLSKVQKQLYDASLRIKELGIKEKDVISYNKVDFEVKNDSLTSTFTKDTKGSVIGLKPIKTPNLEITFDVHLDTVYVSHTYKANLVTVLNRKQDKFTYGGKKRFFLARLINPRYEYWSTNVVDDPDAEIKSDVYINFGRYNK